jgi:hypothetical protein
MITTITATATIVHAVLAQTLPLPVPAPLPPAPEVGRPAPGSAARRAHALERLDPVLVRALFAADPPVDALRAAATALALAEPGRARSFLLRARLAGWLPELRLRVDRRFNRAESVDLGSSTATPFAPVGIDSNNDVRYEVRATWDLGRIVFNPDEIAAHAEALRTADLRREIETAVIRLYFERRRLKAESLAADANEGPPNMKLELRIAEIEAELDALTGGAFTGLSRRSDPAAPAP